MKKITSQKIRQFQKAIYDYYAKQARSLPWRETTNPYHVVISEVMLQQTQAERVVPFYYNFTKRFPTFRALATAPLVEVLAAWQGLGYNRRALFLKKLAETVDKTYGGLLPQTPEALDELPGIGPATAASIAAFAFNSPTVFIETNIRSVFIHFFFPNQTDVSDSELLPFIESALDHKQPRRWYNALMDYGAFLKKTCTNPSRQSRHHQKQKPFHGSNRELRGKIIAAILKNNELGQPDIHVLAKKLEIKPDQVQSALEQLTVEGLLICHKKIWKIAAETFDKKPLA